MKGNGLAWRNGSRSYRFLSGEFAWAGNWKSSQSELRKILFRQAHGQTFGAFESVGPSFFTGKGFTDRSVPTSVCWQECGDRVSILCLSKADSGGFCSLPRVACHAGTSCRGRVARGPLWRPAAIGSLERTRKVEMPEAELQAGSCFAGGVGVTWGGISRRDGMTASPSKAAVR
jgi:hypothetical protein